MGRHRRGPRGRAQDRRARREVRPGDVQRGAARLHGLRRAGRAPRARRPAEGDVHARGGAGQRRRLQRHGRDHRRGVRRRPPRQPGSGSRTEQRLPRRDDGRRPDDLHEHHGRARLGERGSLPAAHGADPPGLGLRREPARGVRDVLRGRGPHLRHDVALPRTAPRRPAPGGQLRVDLRHVHRRPAPRHRPALHDRRAAGRRLGRLGRARRQQRDLQRLPRRHVQLPGRGGRDPLRALRRAAPAQRRAGRRGRTPRGEGHRARLPRSRGRLLLHLRLHAEQAAAVAARRRSRGLAELRGGDPRGRNRRDARRRDGARP